MGEAISAPPRFDGGEPVEHAFGVFHDFTSAITGRDYRVYVDIPAGEPPHGGFPVVYLLDGDLHFPSAVGMARGLAAVGELRRAVIVGIGYPTDDPAKSLVRRFRDLALPASADWIASLGWAAPGMSAENSGGLDDFLAVIDREIRPAVAALTSTDSSDQTLFGHSLGGHAVLRALFTAPGAYRSFVASSPSIWWAEQAVLAEADGLAETLARGEARPRVLLAVGALEAAPDRGALNHFKTRAEAEASVARARMVENVVELGAGLAGLLAGRAGCVVSTVVFEGEGHATVLPAAICRALQFALAPD